MSDSKYGRLITLTLGELRAIIEAAIEDQPRSPESKRRIMEIINTRKYRRANPRQIAM